MKNVMHMEIAGILFSISCDYPLSGERLPQTYMQFIHETASFKGDIHIKVRIETGLMPDTGRMTKVFDTGQSWSLFRQNNMYYLSLSVPTAAGQSIWLAAFDMHCDNISIFCNDLLIKTGNGPTTVSTPLCYPLDQLLLMYILSSRRGALIHAAGLSMANRGYIFPGRSGAGKSTLSRLFLGCNSAEMLSDDRMIIRKMDNSFMAFGTPWAGDAEIAENRRVLLDRIFFIHHAEVNMIEELTPTEAVKRLMPVTSILWHDEEAVQSMLAFCEDMVMNVPAYELHFRPDRDVVACFEDFIVQNKI